MKKVTKTWLSHKSSKSILAMLHGKIFSIFFYCGIFYPKEFDFTEIHDSAQISELLFFGATLFFYSKSTDDFEPFVKLNWFPFGDSNLKLHWLWVLGVRKIKT